MPPFVILQVAHIWISVSFMGSLTSFYCTLWCTINAINMTFIIEFLTTLQQCAEAASKFKSNSHQGIIKNCVGAINGYLLANETPPKCYAKNVCSYFSGHYQKNGINIQASCDTDCCFTFVGIGSPGMTKDCYGIKVSGHTCWLCLYCQLCLSAH